VPPNRSGRISRRSSRAGTSTGRLGKVELLRGERRLNALRTPPAAAELGIENNGTTAIDTRDYAVLDDDKVGIRVSFPGRKVAGMVVTELSDDFLRASFQDGSGLAVKDGTIELPKVPMNRSAHYKVLAALDRADVHTGEPGQFDDPIVVGGIKGGVGGGQTVGATSGALGYSEVGAASARDDLSLVRIGGHRATLDEADHGAYPFWETEYGYTYTEPDAQSLAASFLRYLTNQVGADILRSHGNRPCAELANPALCRPS
jgi:hypothetical protein